jgi:hypothetical protein
LLSNANLHRYALAVEDAAAAAAAKDAAAAKAALDAKAAAPAPAPAATVDARLHVIRAACLDICKNMCTMGVPINPECQPGCTDRCGKERDFPVERCTLNPADPPPPRLIG